MQYSLIKNDFTLVRNEISELKECQTKYVLIVTTIPSIILGISFFSTELILAALIPLLIVLPIWCIFNDKSKSISRLQAFYRILETHHTDCTFITNYMGFENANNEYREKPRDEKKAEKVLAGFKIWNSLDFVIKLKFFLNIISLNKSSRYQTIVFSIFFYSSFFILGLSYYLFTKYSFQEGNTFNYMFLLIILFLIAIIAIACYELLFSLYYGGLSRDDTYNKIKDGWDSQQRKKFVGITAVITIILSLIAIYYFYFSVFDSVVIKKFVAELIIIDIVTILVLVVARYNLKISHGVIDGIYQNNAYKVIWEEIM